MLTMPGRRSSRPHQFPGAFTAFYTCRTAAQQHDLFTHFVRRLRAKRGYTGDL